MPKVLAPKTILGAIFVVLAAVSLWDGYRITTTLRRPGAFDTLGPDRYLMTIAVVILILGVALVAQGMREAQLASADSEESASRRHVWLLGAVCLYAFLIWFLGYRVSTLAFFVASLWIMGMRDWRWILFSAITLTAAYYIMFAHVADISLPIGLFG